MKKNKKKGTKIADFLKQGKTFGGDGEVKAETQEILSGVSPRFEREDASAMKTSSIAKSELLTEYNYASPRKKGAALNKEAAEMLDQKLGTS